MKPLLYSLSEGVQEDDLSEDDLEIVKKLLLVSAIKKTHNSYRLDDKFRIGKLDVASNGVGYLEVFGQKSYKKDLLIEQKDLNTANKDDIVVVKRTFNKNHRPKAKVVLVLKRNVSHSVVCLKKIGKNIIGVNVKNLLHVNICASQKSLKALPEETILKVDNENGVIEEVLGVLSDESVDEKISLALYDKVEDFSKDAQKEALSHGTNVDKSLHVDYLDLTHLPFCTIDPPDAKDFDDAIYFDEKSFTLYVAIADVSSYVFAFGAIDKEARKRGFSIYFPHKSIPMLPRNLSENICSLKPNEDRLAFCFKIILDRATCKVKSEELLKVVINSKKRYNYDDIDLFFEKKYENKDKNDELIFKWLKPLKDLTDKLRKTRLANGYEFRSDEIRMKVDENQQLISTHIEKETPSHALIEDCMLLANKAAAKKIKYGIFRNHESPSYERIEELLVDLEMIGLNFDFNSDLSKLIKTIQSQADNLGIREDVDKLIIKSQKKAMYESENKGHFGLGFDRYTHFTSPIRRYSDLVLHRLLKAKIQNDEKYAKYQLENIDELCENLSKLERQSDRVAWDYMDRKFARWAYRHIGKEYEAIITDVGRNNIAKLDDKLKGARLLVIDEDVELLERVKVKILEANILQASIIVKVTKRLNL